MGRPWGHLGVVAGAWAAHDLPSTSLTGQACGGWRLHGPQGELQRDLG